MSHLFLELSLKIRLAIEIQSTVGKTPVKNYYCTNSLEVLRIQYTYFCRYMLASKVTEKYQATIPYEVRNFLHLEKGDRVKFKIEGDKVMVQKLPYTDTSI